MKLFMLSNKMPLLNGIKTSNFVKTGRFLPVYKARIRFGPYWARIELDIGELDELAELNDEAKMKRLVALVPDSWLADGDTRKSFGDTVRGEWRRRRYSPDTLEPLNGDDEEDDEEDDENTDDADDVEDVVDDENTDDADDAEPAVTLDQVDALIEQKLDHVAKEFGSLLKGLEESFNSAIATAIEEVKKQQQSNPTGDDGARQPSEPPADSGKTPETPADENPEGDSGN